MNNLAFLLSVFSLNGANVDKRPNGTYLFDEVLTSMKDTTFLVRTKYEFTNDSVSLEISYPKSIRSNDISGIDEFDFGDTLKINRCYGIWSIDKKLAIRLKFNSGLFLGLRYDASANCLYDKKGSRFQFSLKGF